MSAAHDKPSGTARPGSGESIAHTRTDKTAAFRALYDARVADVARWVRALGGPMVDRDDVLQEVFAVVHRRLADFDGKNEVGWLYRITARQVRDFRRQLWIKRIFNRSTRSLERLVSPGPSPFAAPETRERRDRLQRLLSKVGEAQRVTFLLFEIEGYTAHEIAEMQGTSVHTVRSRIMRTRKQLSALLKKARAAEER